MKEILVLVSVLVLASPSFGQDVEDVQKSIRDIDFHKLMDGAGRGGDGYGFFKSMEVVKKSSWHLMLIDHPLAPFNPTDFNAGEYSDSNNHNYSYDKSHFLEANEAEFQRASSEFNNTRPAVILGADGHLRFELPFVVYGDFTLSWARAAGRSFLDRHNTVQFLTRVPLGLDPEVLEQLNNGEISILDAQGRIVTELDTRTTTMFSDSNTRRGVFAHFVEPSWDRLGPLDAKDSGGFQDFEMFFSIGTILGQIADSSVKFAATPLSFSITPDQFSILTKAKGTGKNLYVDIPPFGKMVFPLDQALAYFEAQIRDNADYANEVDSKFNKDSEDAAFLDQISNGQFSIAAKAIKQKADAKAAAEAEAARNTPEAINAALKGSVLKAIDEWQVAMKNYSDEYDTFVKGQKTEVRQDYETKQEFADRQKEELKEKKGEEPVFSTVEVQVPLKVTAGKFSPQSKSWPLSFSSVNDWFPISGSEEWKADLSDLKTSYTDGENLIAEKGLSGVATVLVSRDGDRWLLTRTDVEIDSTRDSTSLVEDDSVFAAPFSVKGESIVPGKWTRQKKFTVSPTPVVVPTKNEAVATTAKKTVGFTDQGQTYEKFETSGFASEWTLSAQYNANPLVKLVGAFEGFDGSSLIIINGTAIVCGVSDDLYESIQSTFKPGDRVVVYGRLGMVPSREFGINVEMVEAN